MVTKNIRQNVERISYIDGKLFYTIHFIPGGFYHATINSTGNVVLYTGIKFRRAKAAISAKLEARAASAIYAYIEKGIVANPD